MEVTGHYCPAPSAWSLGRAIMLPAVLGSRSSVWRKPLPFCVAHMAPMRTQGAFSRSGANQTICVGALPLRFSDFTFLDMNSPFPLCQPHHCGLDGSGEVRQATTAPGGRSAAADGRGRCFLQRSGARKSARLTGIKLRHRPLQAKATAGPASIKRGRYGCATRGKGVIVVSETRKARMLQSVARVHVIYNKAVTRICGARA